MDPTTYLRTMDEGYSDYWKKRGNNNNALANGTILAPNSQVTSPIQPIKDASCPESFSFSGDVHV
jgi:hypothetical protein